MPLVQDVLSIPFITSPLTLLSIPLVFLLLVCLYRLYLHPLSPIPGPFLARLTSLYLYTIAYRGTECTTLTALHRKYKTRILRIAPNAVSISDGAALHHVYVASGGFPKDPCYENFKLDGHETIFSTRDPAYRAMRAKVVVPLFAMGRVRAAGEGDGPIARCVSMFVARFERNKAQALRNAPGERKLDLLDLGQRLAVDVVTSYLYNSRYGGLDEDAVSEEKTNAAPAKMSAAPFVAAVVAFGRFFLLPHWAFAALELLQARLAPDAHVATAFDKVHRYAAGLAEAADPAKHDTYQARLLSAGCSESEVAAQVKDLMFAGTDSTATNLSTVLFRLAQNPAALRRLAEELRGPGADPSRDPQTLPYLRAVVREGLRMGMANPTRLPRTTPRSGFLAAGYRVPGGTSVGLSLQTLHFNAEAFPQPERFLPERWLDDENGYSTETRRLRDRDYFPFGLGTRGCIARNLATHELFMAVRGVVGSGVLEGARGCGEVVMDEWFNARVRGGKVEVRWD